ncbi:MAG: ABC transporter permease [Candidatus Dormibacteraeota bacterium]|nr:ABC transporter permease [Candidatus Dormibacteraeota bacterium]
MPTLLGVATIVFMLVRLLPGDPAAVIAGPQATALDVERIRQQLNLDQPLWLQYVSFLGRLAQGNLGVSTRSGHTVVEEIFTRAPYTLQLAIVASVVATVVGVLLGVIASTRPNSKLDVSISSAAVFGISMPVYWLGLMLIVIFSIKLHEWHLGGLPAAGASDPAGFVLPSVTLALFSVGLVARMTRSSMLEVLGQDFVRTARAKGAGRRTVLVRHALRNALLPVLTAVSLQFGSLLGGAVLTETVFSWPGIGRLLVDSIFARDYPVVQGVVLVFAVAFIAVNLLTDLLYAYVDPRIRYG